MSPTIPDTMRSLCIYSYREPAEFEISTIPTPKIVLPNHVLIKVAAGGINPADMQQARGEFKMVLSVPFPYKLGLEMSGTVVAVGEAVKDLKIGDEVFGFLPFPMDTGGLSEYARTTEPMLALKPKGISHIEAASLSCASLTALQCFEKLELDGGVREKTVLITSGLGGVGSLACQLAKNVFGAAKVLTTVSTEKVGKIDKLLGNGVIDQIVDYKKTDVVKEIPHGSVDFMIDSTYQAIPYAPLISKPQGKILSIQGHMSAENIRGVLPDINSFIIFIFGIEYWIFKFRLYLKGVKFDSLLQKPSSKGIRSIAKWIDEGKLKPVVGKTVKLEDIEAVREACTQIASGKGGLGKTVVVVS